MTTREGRFRAAARQRRSNASTCRLRAMRRTERPRLLRASARPVDALLHRDVGAVLVLRYSAAADPVHDGRARARRLRIRSRRRRRRSSASTRRRVYLASLPGGWIADRWLGLQPLDLVGAACSSRSGHLSIALSRSFSRKARSSSDSILIVIGTGLLKPNISAIVGDLYPEGGARRDAGFSIFYMGINIGALLAPARHRMLGEKVGWHWGFGAAGVGMLIGLITLQFVRDRTLGPIGSSRRGTPIRPSRPAGEQREARRSASGSCVLRRSSCSPRPGTITLDPQAIGRSMTFVLVGMARRLLRLHLLLREARRPTRRSGSP